MQEKKKVMEKEFSVTERESSLQYKSAFHFLKEKLRMTMGLTDMRTSIG
jgi:hypothetical protein